VSKDGQIDDVAIAAIIQDNSMNFGRHGRWHSTTGAMYPFFKVILQSNIKGLRDLKTPAGQALAGKYVAMAVVVSLVGQFMAKALSDDGEDEEAWDRVQWYAKRVGIPIPTKGGKYVVIPMGPDWTIFGSLGMVLGDLYGKMKRTTADGLSFGQALDMHGTDAALKMVSAMSNVYNPTGGDAVENGEIKLENIAMGLLPTGAKDVAEYINNRNAFGAPIRPMFMDDNAPKAYQYYGTPSAIALGLTDAMNKAGLPWASGGTGLTRGSFDMFSPNDIDYIIKALTSSAGGDLSKLSDAAVAGYDVASGNETEWNATKAPVLARFYREIPKAEQDNRFIGLSEGKKSAISDVNKKKDISEKGGTILDKDFEALSRTHKWRMAYTSVPGPDITKDMVDLANDVKAIERANRQFNAEKKRWKNILVTTTSVDRKKEALKNIKDIKELTGQNIRVMVAKDKALEKMWRLNKQEKK